VGARVLQPQLDEIALGELEVVDGLGADQDGVGPRLQPGEGLGGRRTLEVGVLQRRGAGEGRCVDAVEVLEVVEDVLLSVL
jgi:hypothetical protein